MRTRTTLRRASRAPILRRMKRGACSPEETTQILEDQQPDHRLGLRGGQPAVLGEPGGCRGRAGIEERRTDDERLDRVEARRQRSRESDGHVDVEVEESADREAGSPGEEPRQPELRSGAEQQEDQARVRGEEALLGTGNAGVPDICPGQDGARHGGTGRCFERIARAALSIQVPSSWLSKFFSCSGSPDGRDDLPFCKGERRRGTDDILVLAGDRNDGGARLCADRSSAMDVAARLRGMRQVRRSARAEKAIPAASFSASMMAPVRMLPCRRGRGAPFLDEADLVAPRLSERRSNAIARSVSDFVPMPGRSTDRASMPEADPEMLFERIRAPSGTGRTGGPAGRTPPARLRALPLQQSRMPERPTSGRESIVSY